LTSNKTKIILIPVCLCWVISYCSFLVSDNFGNTYTNRSSNTLK